MAERRAQFGWNELVEKKKNPILVFLGHFWGPMPIMIWIAILVQGPVQAIFNDKGGDWPDFFVLLVLQIVNGMVGWYEGVKAGNAIEALKESLGTTAHVRRNNKWVEVPQRDLVPGDRVQLSLGGSVPADCALLDGKVIAVDQAALTGESMPVKMFPGDVAKMGSNVTQGEIDAIVRHTGADTFFGKTASMIQGVKSEGHFQKLLWRITLVLMGFSFVLVTIIFIYMMTRTENPQSNIDQSGRIINAVSKCVVLLIASIPIAMQVVCTSTMALGARRLAQKKAVVTRLGAIEELAGMDMLCSDKTGTLTTGKMEMQEPLLFGTQFAKQDILRDAVLAAKWMEEPKDAIDTLVLNYCKADLEGYDKAFNQTDYVPFDPAVKRTEATLVPRDGKSPEFKCTKGAPHIILQMAHNYEDLAEEVTATINDLASRGTRALGVARTDADGRWCFTGILTFLDPPRHDTKETIARARELGIEVKMITGDQVAIAKETCFKLGMGTNIKGTELLPGSTADISLQSSSRFGEICEEADGFAEVFPEHKYMIVDVLQRRKWTTGMTGDGVNDAPALKKADIGIAVQGATDAARAAADIVLTEPGLSVIIDAIRYSRKIFHRMKNYVTYRIACTMQLLVFFFIAILAVQPDLFHHFVTGYNHTRDEYCDPKHHNATLHNPHCNPVDQYFALPVIALVVITILNDGTIITIARDKVIPGTTPEKWMLWHVIIVASLLGMIACASSIILLWQALCAADADTLGVYNDPNHIAQWDQPNDHIRVTGGVNGACGDWKTIKDTGLGSSLFTNVFHADFSGVGISIEQARTIMYLKISLSDFLTVFSARTRGPFWERRPGYGLLTAFFAATLTSTLLAVYWPGGGNEDPMAAIDWGQAGVVWLYCIVFFLIGDFAKWGLNKTIFHFFIQPDQKGPADQRTQLAKNRYQLALERKNNRSVEDLGALTAFGNDAGVPRSMEEVVARIATLTGAMEQMQGEIQALSRFATRQSGLHSRTVSREGSRTGLLLNAAKGKLSDAEMGAGGGALEAKR